MNEMHCMPVVALLSHFGHVTIKPANRYAICLLQMQRSSRNCHTLNQHALAEADREVSSQQQQCELLHKCSCEC